MTPSEKFIASNNLTYISFTLVNSTVSDKNKLLSTGTPYKFLTLDEVQERAKNFLTYFLALLLLTFVTIPAAVKTFRDLWKGDS